MSYLTEFLTVALLHLLAVISPGPDFAIVTKNSLVYSRKAGICCSIGVGIGIIVHVTYSIVGIGLIISKSILLFSTIKYLGAAYLIYIGYKSIKSKDNLQIKKAKIKKETSPWQSFKAGFLTNALNPKATLFFLSLFTLVIKTSTPFWLKLLYGAEMSIVTFLWFSIVAIILSHDSVKNYFSRIQHQVERVMGVVLILFGIKVALSKLE